MASDFNSLSERAGRRYDKALLQTPLESGRRCDKGACHDRCALAIADGLLTDSEAQRLILHFQHVWRKSQKRSGEASKGKPMIDLSRSVIHSSTAEHLFFLRIVERLRTSAAAIFGVPAKRLKLASHFVSEIGNRSEGESTLHVDEASFRTFHHSAVLWLNPLQAAPTAADDRRSFEGGRITFWRELEQPWLAAEPVAGRAAFFSSGWENAHRVSPVTSGKRWALNLFLTAAAAPPPRAVQFVDECVEPGSLEAWESCERRWSHWLG